MEQFGGARRTFVLSTAKDHDDVGGNGAAVGSENLVGKEKGAAREHEHA